MSSGKRGTKIDMLAGSAQLLPTQHPEASATLPALSSSPVGDTPESASKKPKRSRSPKDDTDHTSSVKISKPPSISESKPSPFTARKASPWEIYKKHFDLDLNGPVTVPQGKAGLVAVRTFTVAAAEKALYMHGRVRHPNIVKALEAFTTETSFYIPAILRQVLDGLIYLESEGLEHGSINCRNILLSTGGDVKIANQQCCEKTEKTQRNREPQDVRALGIITMELMQKYTQDNGAVGVENLDRWPSDPDAVTFLSETTSAASARELRKHALLRHGDQKDVLMGLDLNLHQFGLKADEASTIYVPEIVTFDSFL
ncbi:hypothetical protein GMDG_06232 [Pseudogymnoascus destructans 20631-21]|uniref:Serine-threonine/tyrosine-protein kinase catalytic domain-containing protein n=1 Tax=Pseudogymnoascus destructans (strain ATCC MYA-4855 / 20631-21) TaxID=658429 RepID=L8FSN8_PSED2|nr:hypothetical protein GMDG_06232 [Pseudogymnoascus destructans 20631-21]